MRIVELPEILAALDEDAALAAVESGLRRLHTFEAQVAAVGHLSFPDAPGDCHIKSAYMAGDEVLSSRSPPASIAIPPGSRLSRAPQSPAAHSAILRRPT